MATKTKERRAKQTDQEELEIQADTLLEPKKGGGNGGNGKTHAKRPVYSHETRRRCGRCGAMMRSAGTREGGRVKRWICTAPICRATEQSVGQTV